MIPEALLDLELELPGWVRPRYLTGRDHLWVQYALDELDACAGLRAEEVLPRVSRPPRLGERPRAWRALVRLLLRLQRFRIEACVPPARIRETVFALAARPGASREVAIAEAAAALGISTESVVGELYADLPCERRLTRVELPCAQEVIERYNLVLAQSLLLRCEKLRVRLHSSVRGVIRFARLQRLLCLTRRDPVGDGLLLLLSGPLALFHHTTKYGRAMAAWLPVVVRCPGWDLEASCLVDGERRTWRASFRDPLGTTHAPLRRFDSALEERLFRDLRRLRTRWQVLREADPVQIGEHILCPDFTLVDGENGRRVCVELVGFWTPEYLAAKLALLPRLPRDRPWVFCVDRALAASFEAVKTEGPLLFFDRRVPARELLELVERSAPGPPAEASAAGRAPCRTQRGRDAQG